MGWSRAIVVWLAVGTFTVGSRAADSADAGQARDRGGFSDTAFAHELLRLKQIDLMQLQEKEAGATAGDLWRAELILAQYDELTKDKSREPAVARDYVTALQGTMHAQQDLDGAWALDHAKFLLSKLAQPIVTRMEYWGERQTDRAQLAPLANLAGDLLAGGGRTLTGKLKELEGATPFDDKAYAVHYAAAAEIRYYGAWADYFRAMGMPADAAARRELLSHAASALGEWAVSDTDNGVNMQAFLLRGKVNGALGKYKEALADFAQASTDKAPEGIGFQARYQAVVVNLEAGDLGGANDAFNALRKWIPKGNDEAVRTADMLAFRVAWAAAAKKPAGSLRHDAQLAAMDNLRQVSLVDPRFRSVAYQELAATIPENTDEESLLPMQLLAVAFDQSQGWKGDTAEGKAHLMKALAAAKSAEQRPDASSGDKAEAILLEGACNALLGNEREAAALNVSFAEKAPWDPRARQVIDLALEQIGELRQGNDPAHAGELTDLADRALALATQTFGDAHWLFAQGRILEEKGKAAEAAAAYQKVLVDDPNYLDARYRLIALAMDRFKAAEGKAGDREQQQAAAELFDACTAFVTLLDHPPAAAPAEVLEAAKGYRLNIWLIETATALSPKVHRPEVALDRLAKLEAAKGQLSAAQQRSLLQYRIEAWQMDGQPEKAAAAVQEFVRSGGPEAVHALEGMALSAADQIDAAEAKDPAEARRLAAFVVQLLDPIGKQALSEGKAESAFEDRLIQADMMVRAGEYGDAIKLADDLEGEKPADIRGYMTEARAYFFEAQAKKDSVEFAKAQDEFTRVLARLTPGGEGFWEAWLRIIESMEAQNGDAAATQIKTRLSDLKAVYGDKFGGERFKEDFAKLAAKYGVE